MVAARTTTSDGVEVVGVRVEALDGVEVLEVKVAAREDVAMVAEEGVVTLGRGGSSSLLLTRKKIQCMSLLQSRTPMKSGIKLRGKLVTSKLWKVQKIRAVNQKSIRTIRYKVTLSIITQPILRSMLRTGWLVTTAGCSIISLKIAKGSYVKSVVTVIILLMSANAVCCGTLGQSYVRHRWMTKVSSSLKNVWIPGYLKRRNVLVLSTSFKVWLLGNRLSSSSCTWLGPALGNVMLGRLGKTSLS